MNPNRLWYLCLQDEAIGPLTETSLYSLIRNQRLSGHDFAWHDGMPTWGKLADTAQFSSFFQKVPRLLPPLKATPPASKMPEMVKSNSTGKTEPTLLSRPQRIAIEGWVRFDQGDLHRVLNISESGVLVSIPKNVPVIGKEVRFRLESPVFGKPLEMTGVLIREDFTGHDNSVAIEFTRLNPAYRRMIKEYIQLSELKKAS